MDSEVLLAVSSASCVCIVCFCILFGRPGDCFYAFSAEDTRVNIFIGNLAFTATEEDLRQLFEPYGAVDTINLLPTATLAVRGGLAL